MTDGDVACPIEWSGLPLSPTLSLLPPSGRAFGLSPPSRTYREANFNWLKPTQKHPSGHHTNDRVAA